MEYKGKKSKTVWHPECTFSYNGSEFSNTAVFAKIEDAMELIDEWIYKVTHFNIPAFEIVIKKEYMEVRAAMTKERLYEFQIWPMCYYD